MEQPRVWLCQRGRAVQHGQQHHVAETQPRLLELLRSKSGTTYRQSGGATDHPQKGMPAAYNKDLQEDKGTDVRQRGHTG